MNECNNERMQMPILVIVCILGNKKINTEMLKIFLMLIFTFKFNPRRNALLCRIHSQEFYTTGMENILYRIYGRHFIVYMIGNHMNKTTCITQRRNIVF